MPRRCSVNAPPMPRRCSVALPAPRPPSGPHLYIDNGDAPAAACAPRPRLYTEIALQCTCPRLPNAAVFGGYSHVTARQRHHSDQSIHRGGGTRTRLPNCPGPRPPPATFSAGAHAQGFRINSNQHGNQPKNRCCGRLYPPWQYIIPTHVASRSPGPRSTHNHKQTPHSNTHALPPGCYYTDFAVRTTKTPGLVGLARFSTLDYSLIYSLAIMESGSTLMCIDWRKMQIARVCVTHAHRL